MILLTIQTSQVRPGSRDPELKYQILDLNFRSKNFYKASVLMCLLLSSFVDVGLVKEVCEKDHIASVDAHAEHDILNTGVTVVALVQHVGGCQLQTHPNHHLRQLAGRHEHGALSRDVDARCTQRVVSVHERMDCKVHPCVPDHP